MWQLCSKKTRDSLTNIIEINYEELLLKPKRKQTVLDSWFNTPPAKKMAPQESSGEDDETEEDSE